MELDDLKTIWSEFDKKISDSIKLNEELLVKSIKNSARGELKNPLNSEIINIIGIFLGGVFIITMSIKYIEELRFCIPGFLSLLLGLVYIVFSIIKINRIQSIDYIGSGIIKLQKDFVKLEKLFLKMRKYELIILPFIPVLILPIVYKSIANIDIYNNVKKLIIDVLVILGVSYPIIIWYSKSFIDKKFKNANKILNNLDKFEKEK